MASSTSPTVCDIQPRLATLELLLLDLHWTTVGQWRSSDDEKQSSESELMVPQSEVDLMCENMHATFENERRDIRGIMQNLADQFYKKFADAVGTLQCQLEKREEKILELQLLLEDSQPPSASKELVAQHDSTGNEEHVTTGNEELVSTGNEELVTIGNEELVPTGIVEHCLVRCSEAVDNRLEIVLIVDKSVVTKPPPACAQPPNATRSNDLFDLGKGAASRVVRPLVWPDHDNDDYDPECEEQLSSTLLAEEPLFLFLDMMELACISQSCQRSYELVAEHTPFFSFSDPDFNCDAMLAGAEN